MGAISDAINQAVRDFETDGVAASGLHPVGKDDVRAIGPVIEAAINNAAIAGLAEVAYATKAELNADLAYAAGAIGMVYADPIDANNDLYVKSGASGAGAWAATTIIHDIVGNAAAAYATEAEGFAADAEEAAGALLVSSRAGSPTNPNDGAAAGDFTFTEVGTLTETQLFTHVTFFAKALTTARFLTATRSGTTETVRRYVEVVPSGLGLITMTLPTPLLGVVGEKLGVYAPGVIPLTSPADPGRAVYGSGAGYNATFNDAASFDGSLEFYLHSQGYTVDEVIAVQEATSLATQAGPPDWVEDPSQYEIDFTRGLFWDPDEGRATPLHDQLFVQTAAGASVDTKGRLVKFPANAARLTDRGLRIDAYNTTNLLANAFAPATQTLHLAAGIYTVSCGKDGTLTLSGGVTDIARPGLPVTFTLALAADVTFTVGGTPQWFQCEAGEFPSMPVDGARAGDVITPAGKLASVLQGAAYTAIIETDAIMPNFSLASAAPVLGAAGASLLYDRRLASDQAGLFYSSGGSISHTIKGTFEQVARGVVTGDATISALSVGGAVASTTANALKPAAWLGRNGSTDPTGTHQSGMFIRKLAFKPVKVSNATAALLSLPASRIHKEVIYHPSTIDPALIPALDATVCYDDQRKGAPLLVIMHGYGQSMTDFDDWAFYRLAQRGFFVIAPNMRGRPAFTYRDCSGRELVDILDGIDVVRDRYRDYVHRRDTYLFGYSGGGGNALGLAMKAPDSFNLIASHFGMSDYGYDDVNSWYFTNATREFQSGIEDAVGGVPNSSPVVEARLRSRYAIEGIPINLKGGHLVLLHDVDDANVDVRNSQLLAAAMTAAGNGRYEYFESSAANFNRWVHGLPNNTASVTRGENHLTRRILAGEFRPWEYPLTGSARVHGFLRTRHFQVWLDDGKSSVATVDFDVRARGYTVTPVTTNAPITVTVTQGALSVTQVINAATVLTPV
jgi:pimeloyl-ACP methyl ester carboxylesterase